MELKNELEKLNRYTGKDEKKLDKQLVYIKKILLLQQIKKR